MNAEVTNVINLPESLSDSVKKYIESHEGWDVDRFFCSATSLFLMQNSGDKNAAKTYLQSLFGEAA